MADIDSGYTVPEWLQLQQRAKNPTATGPLTPTSAEGYSTPEQIKNAREYANYLLSGGGQQPVKSWTQGVSNMVSALVGGNMQYSQAQREKQGMDVGAQQLESGVPRGNYPSAPVGTSAPPSDRGDLTPTQRSSGRDVSSIGGSDPTSRGLYALAGNETGHSKNEYSQLGPVINNPKSAYYGDRAYGKYQVMGKNIPEWSKEVLGRSITVQEYMANPDLQEQIARGKFGPLMAKYGPEGAARAWLAGEGGMHKNVADQYGSTPQSYGAKFMRSFGPTTSEVQQAPAVQAMTAALNGGGGAPAPAPTPAPTPEPQVAGDVQAAASRSAAPPPSPVMPQGNGQIFVNPAMIGERPGWTPEQLRGLLANPWIPQAQKDAALGMMMQRGGAIQVPNPNGPGTIWINPNDPRQQQFFAPPPELKPNKLGDFEFQRSYGYDQRGNPVVRSPQAASPGPQSNAAPAMAPGGGMPQGGGVVQASAETAPDMPSSPANATAGGGAPVQVASNDPSAGAAEAARGSVQPASAETVAAAEEKPPLAQLAGGDDAMRKLVGDDQLYDAWRQQQDLKAMQAGREQGAKSTGELGAKRYDDIISRANGAQTALSEVKTMQGLLNNPHMHFGLGHELKDTGARAMSQWNPEKYNNAPNEIFDKGASGLVLGELKPVLQGTGQVRVAEVNLLNTANANRNMSKEANETVLKLTEKALQRAVEIGKMASQYRKGQDVTDPITGEVMLKAGKGDRSTIGPDFDAVTEKYWDQHHLLTDAEYKSYNKMLGMDAGEEKATGTMPTRPPSEPETKKFKTPTPSQIQELQQNPQFRESFEKHFGPADQYLGGK